MSDNNQNSANFKFVDDRWRKHNKQLQKIPSDSLIFLKNPYFAKIITMPLKKNTRMCKQEVNMILKYFKDLKNINVLEIGAGFGNFCRVLCKKIRVSSYTILDTKTMLKFTKTFLRHYKVNQVNFIDINKFETIYEEKFDLFISISCLSETPKNYRTLLLDKILPNCEKLFVIEADKRAHPGLNGGYFNEWLEKTIKTYFAKVKIEEIPYRICYQRYSHVTLGEK